MYHYKVGNSGSVIRAEASLADALRRWIDQSWRFHQKQALDESPDQALFTVGWVPLLVTLPEHPAREWLFGFRDVIDDFFTRQDLWFHGYWRSHELGRGMAHFVDFLGGLWQLNPEDPITIEMLVDAAEHLGNWSDDVPEWFDWNTGLFRSVYLGTDGPKDPELYTCNVPQHMRALDLALLAYRMTGQSHFLDLALTGANRWAEAILANETYPLLLGGDGGVGRLMRRDIMRYHEFLSPGVIHQDNTARARAILQVGGIQLLLKLWQYSRDQRLIDAVERTLDLLVVDLVQPDAYALIGALRFYRNHTGRLRYDDDVLQAVEALFPYFVDSVDLDRAVGSRADLRESQPGRVPWRENTHARQHNPLLLGLAAEISGNERLATRALDLGRGYLELARRAFPDGRECPGAAETVSAVVRGGQYDNGAGIITELWKPLRERFCADPNVRKAGASRKPFPLRLSR